MAMPTVVSGTINQIWIGNELYDIEAKNPVEGAMRLIGTNAWPASGSTRITDGATGATIASIKLKGGTTINASNLMTGDVVLQVHNDSASASGYEEYVWVKTSTSSPYGYWELLGDEDAYVLKSTVPHTTGSPSSTTTITPIFTGTEKTISLSGPIEVDAPVQETTATTVTPVSFSTTTWTPAGTVGINSATANSGHTFEGTEAVLSTIIVPKGTVTIDPATGASGHTIAIKTLTINPFISGRFQEDLVSSLDYATLTIPSGINIGATATTDSGHYFAGDEVTLTHNATKETVQSDGSYTKIKSMNVAITPTTTAVFAGTATEGNGVLLGTVTGSVLQLYNLTTTPVVSTLTYDWSFTTTIDTVTVTTKKAVVTDISDHEFTPSGTIKGSHNLTSSDIDLSDYIAPMYETKTFELSGTIYGTHKFTGSDTTVSVTYTPEGTIKGDHKFTGTAKTLTISKRLIAKVATTITASGKYTPEGTISSIEMPSTTHTHQLTLN